MKGYGLIKRAAILSVAALLLGLSAFREPGLAADAADGTYVHDCCGAVVLRGGRMDVGGGKWVDYELGTDEAGPYLLPETFVGTWEERGFEVDGTRAPIKLRLDRLPNPGRIAVPAARGWRGFDRKSPQRLKLRH